MKKILSLLLLMITISGCVGCDSKSDELTLSTPIHSLQKINGKRTTDKIVYTAKNKRQYHRSSCRHMEYTNGVKLSDAKKMGLMPCKVCKP